MYGPADRSETCSCREGSVLLIHAIGAANVARGAVTSPYTPFTAWSGYGSRSAVDATRSPPSSGSLRERCCPREAALLQPLPPAASPPAPISHPLVRTRLPDARPRASPVETPQPWLRACKGRSRPHDWRGRVNGVGSRCLRALRRWPAGGRLHDNARHVGQPEIAAAVGVSELCVVEAHRMENIACRLFTWTGLSMALSPKSPVAPYVMPPFTPPPAARYVNPAFFWLRRFRTLIRRPIPPTAFARTRRRSRPSAGRRPSGLSAHRSGMIS